MTQNSPGRVVALLKKFKIGKTSFWEEKGINVSSFEILVLCNIIPSYDLEQKLFCIPMCDFSRVLNFIDVILNCMREYPTMKSVYVQMSPLRNVSLQSIDLILEFFCLYTCSLFIVVDGYPEIRSWIRGVSHAIYSGGQLQDHEQHVTYVNMQRDDVSNILIQSNRIVKESLVSRWVETYGFFEGWSCKESCNF